MEGGGVTQVQAHQQEASFLRAQIRESPVILTISVMSRRGAAPDLLCRCNSDGQTLVPWSKLDCHWRPQNRDCTFLLICDNWNFCIWRF